MSHITAITYIVWSLLSGILLVFFLCRIWSVDRFQSLRWSSKHTTGRMKRIMTLCCLLGITLLFIHCLGFAIIKFKEGHETGTEESILKPWYHWNQTHQRSIVPLYVLLSIGWSIEIFVFLEELCYWIYLLDCLNKESKWFRSTPFYCWIAGSLFSAITLIGLIFYTKESPELLEAWTALVGATYSSVVTLWSAPVLFSFPRFIRRAKSSLVAPEIIVRLQKFHLVNILRVAFRVLFAIPLLIYATNSAWSIKHGNSFGYGTCDFLLLTSAMGFITSTMITIMIFLPGAPKHNNSHKVRETRSLSYAGKTEERAPLQEQAEVNPRSRIMSTYSNDSESQYTATEEDPTLDTHMSSSSSDVEEEIEKALRELDYDDVENSRNSLDRLVVHHREHSPFHPLDHSFVHSPIDDGRMSPLSKSPLRSVQWESDLAEIDSDESRPMSYATVLRI